MYDFASVQRAAVAVGESRRLAEIEAVLVPNGARDSNQLVDVAAAYIAAYFGAVLLVFYGDADSQPSRLLAKAKELRACGVEVSRTDETVEYVKKALWAAGASKRYRKLLDGLERGG